MNILGSLRLPAIILAFVKKFATGNVKDASQQKVVLTSHLRQLQPAAIQERGAQTGDCKLQVITTVTTT